MRHHALLKKLQAAALVKDDVDDVRRLNAEALNAKDAAVKAARRAAKWSAKVLNHKKELEKMGETVMETNEPL